MAKNRLILPVLLTAATGVLGSCGYVDQLRSMRAYQKAHLAYGSQDYEEAITQYMAASENAPLSPAIQIPIRFYTGSSHHMIYRPGRTGDSENEAHLEEAISAYRDTLQMVEEARRDPDIDEPTGMIVDQYEEFSIQQLAGIYRDYVQDFAAAEEFFQRLIDMAPEEPARYYNLADLYQRFHDEEENPLIEKAIEAYQKPVELDPSDTIRYRQVANLLNEYGRFDETMEWLARARDVDPADPEGYYLIATYYWDKVYRDPDLTQRDRDAYIDLGIEQLDLALERNDEYVDALVYKNLLLREKAKIDPRNASTYIAQADEYRARAIELREQREEEERRAAAEAAEAARADR